MNHEHDKGSSSLGKSLIGVRPVVRVSVQGSQA